MAQLPPPVHGAALRNKSLLESAVINREFTIIPLPLFFADEVRDIGKFSIKKLWKTFVYCGQLIAILMSKKVDVAYFTMSPAGFAFYRDLMIVTILKLFRVKRLYHFRVKGIRKTANSPVGRWLVRYALKGADIIGLSNHHLSDFNNLFFRQPFIVPNGIKVEPESLQASPEKEAGSRLKLLFISNLARSKGVFDLINALALLHQKGVDFSAELVGAEHDVTYKELNRAIGEAGMSGKVTVPGPKFSTEKFRLLAEADIFVFPTYFELFPGVVLEAMQFGKAIVASNEGSIPEIIDDGINGVLFPKQDVVQLANALEKVMTDGVLRQKIGINAKEKFFSQYTLDKFETKMKAVFYEVANNRR